MTLETEAKLRARIETLEAELAYYRDLLAPPARVYRELGLSRQLSAILKLLLTGRILRLDAFLTVMEDTKKSGSTYADTTVRIRICHLRKALEPFGVTIQTHWGQGYSISQQDCETLKSFIGDL